MKVHSTFESGNIEFVAEQNSVFQLKIRKDSNANYFQWFYFAVSSQANKPCQFQIINAGESSYPVAWREYQAVMSYDRKNWQRVPTRYDEANKKLIIEHTPEQDLVFYAYFVPFTYEDHLNWLAKIQSKCKTQLLTTTPDGRMLHLLQIGEAAPHKRKCWFTVRQHAGEVMASWFACELVERLLDDQDAVSRKLLDDAVFYIIPMMNPDGIARGNLRANANGLDLNRQWQTPDKNLSPEIFYTREKMQELGVDFFMDVHGDEELPYVFLANAGDNLNHTERQQQLEDSYSDALLTFSPEFQTQYGYEKASFKESTPTLACNHVAETYDCLAFTLEMPFKDNKNLPDAVHGWSPERSAKFAYSVLQALLSVLAKLR